jgi:hypothetical protein
MKKDLELPHLRCRHFRISFICLGTKKTAGEQASLYVDGERYQESVLHKAQNHEKLKVMSHGPSYPISGVSPPSSGPIPECNHTPAVATTFLPHTNMNTP